MTCDLSLITMKILKSCCLRHLRMSLTKMNLMNHHCQNLTVWIVGLHNCPVVGHLCWSRFLVGASVVAGGQLVLLEVLERRVLVEVALRLLTVMLKASSLR